MEKEDTMEYYLHRWPSQTQKEKAVVQIIHGMGEHAGRYDRLATFLAEQGYYVVASDHRGHGKSVRSTDELGKISSFKPLVDDEIEITQTIKAEFADLPYFILGHSMGSFIAQAHMQQASNLVSGYILSGSCGSRVLMSKVGAFVGDIVSLVNRKKPSKLMKKLIFMGNNDKLSSDEKKDNKTHWLTKKDEEVDLYDEDPFSGFAYIAPFYRDFLKFLSTLYDVKKFDAVSRRLPLYIFSGAEDPIGLYGKGTKKLYDFYDKTLGFSQLDYHLYENGRHEMINEKDYLAVQNDILAWLEKKL